MEWSCSELGSIGRLALMLHDAGTYDTPREGQCTVWGWAVGVRELNLGAGFFGCCTTVDHQKFSRSDAKLAFCVGRYRLVGFGVVVVYVCLGYCVLYILECGERYIHMYVRPFVTVD